MESPQTDGVSPSDVTDTAEIPAPKITRERCLIALVATVVVGLILAAIWQAVGLDVMRQVRRWSSRRSRAAPTLIDPVLTTAADADSSVRPLNRSNAIAANSQISPPRRRVPGHPRDSQEAAHPLAAVPNGDSSDVPIVKIDGPAAATETMAGPAVGRPADSAAGMLQAAAQLLNLSWQNFDYPIRWHAADTSRQRMVYGNHRNRLIKVIAHTSPSTLSLDLARKDYAAARAQFSEDPRLDYAFGLVLWKHGQFAEAIEMFQIAARLEGVPFLPAALAVAWGRFLNHDERRGLDQLAHIARLLGTSSGPYPTELQKEQTALSIGRALGFLSGPGQSPELAETVELTSINIFKRLPDNLRSACEEGRAQVGQRQSELLQLTSIPQDWIRSDHRLQHDELQSRIDTLREEMRDARNSMSRVHLSYLDTIKNVLQEGLDMRAQMEKLRPKIKQLTDELMRLSLPQRSFNGQPGNNQGGPASPRQMGQTATVSIPQNLNVLLPETGAERAARVSKQNKTRDERKNIEQELTKLRDQQTDLVARRHAAERDHKLENDEARKARVARMQEQRQIEQKLQSLNKALRRTMALRDGVETIAAYVPWNVEVEGEALWQALAQGGKQKKEAREANALSR